MPYRPPSHPPETAWARHLDSIRRERGWSVVRLFEEVGADLGYAPKSRSAILPLLWNREPDAAQAAVLRRRFGDPPADLAPATAPTPDLAAAIAALTDELRLSRVERESTEARLRAVEAELQSLRETRAGAGSPGLPALRG